MNDVLPLAEVLDTNCIARILAVVLPLQSLDISPSLASRLRQKLLPTPSVRPCPIIVPARASPNCPLLFVLPAQLLFNGRDLPSCRRD